MKCKKSMDGWVRSKNSYDLTRPCLNCFPQDTGRVMGRVMETEHTKSGTLGIRSGICVDKTRTP